MVPPSEPQEPEQRSQPYEYDRVWVLEWVFARDLVTDLPADIADVVADAAAQEGLLLIEAYQDNHDDVDGGDPDLEVWRFYLRVPATSHPPAPHRRQDQHTDFWLMPVTAWPRMVVLLGGLIAGLADAADVPGRLHATFSPSLTNEEFLRDLVNHAYGEQLALLESALSGFHTAYETATGQKLPGTLVSPSWDRPSDTLRAHVTFFVGSEGNTWRTVAVSVTDTPEETDGETSPTWEDWTDTGLPVSAPDYDGVPDSAPRWRLRCSSGHETTGPLPQALAAMMDHLRTLPTTEGTTPQNPQ